MPEQIWQAETLSPAGLPGAMDWRCFEVMPRI